MVTLFPLKNIRRRKLFWSVTLETYHHYVRLKQKTLFPVNVASNCGYTYTNYRELIDMYDRLHHRGLEILAFPSNQFGNQEPGTDDEIQTFCKNYGVNFPVMAKVGHWIHVTYDIYQRLSCFFVRSTSMALVPIQCISSWKTFLKIQMKLAGTLPNSWWWMACLWKGIHHALIRRKSKVILSLILMKILYLRFNYIYWCFTKCELENGQQFLVNIVINICLFALTFVPLWLWRRLPNNAWSIGTRKQYTVL